MSKVTARGHSVGSGYEEYASSQNMYRLKLSLKLGKKVS